MVLRGALFPRLEQRNLVVRYWDRGNLGDRVVPPATVTVDAAIDNGGDAAFPQLIDLRF
jgi:hypothetical protein